MYIQMELHHLILMFPEVDTDIVEAVYDYASDLDIENLRIIEQILDNHCLMSLDDLKEELVKQDEDCNELELEHEIVEKYLNETDTILIKVNNDTYLEICD